MNRSHEPFQKQVVRFLKTQGSPRRAGGRAPLAGSWVRGDHLTGDSFRDSFCFVMS